jgi:plastocyanin
MLKNMYVSRRISWYSLLMLVFVIILTACGGDSNPTTVTTTPTADNTSIVGTTNTPTALSPTSSRPTPTPTLSRPTPTPTVFRPSPTPTPIKPTPTPTPTKPTPTPTPGPTVVVTIITQSNGAFAFSPQTLSITAGTTVTWNNNTAAPHTVTGSSFGSAGISPGGSYSFKFTQAGTFAYHCMFHPYMTGSVNVK